MGAAVISPSSWAYRECFLVSTSSVTSRDGWSAAIKTHCPGFNYAGEYQVWYAGARRTTNMVIGCDNSVEQPGIFKDKLHFDQVKTQCDLERDAGSQVYILNSHGAGKYECLKQKGTGTGTLLVGSHYIGRHQYWGTIEYLLTKKTDCSKAESPSCYTDYQPNTGLFPDDHLIQQRDLISQQDCKAWCDQYSNCLAAVISPSSWAYRECFLVSTSSVTSRDGWSAAIKTHCPESPSCYTDYQPNTGLFPDDHIIQQRELISQQDCKAWCDQYSHCLAAVISPSTWAYRECFLVSTS